MKTKLKLNLTRRKKHLIRLPPPHPNQQIILESSARFRVVACGRRFGKTFVGLYAILAAAARGQKCWWLAPTYAMSTDVWEQMQAVTAHLPGRRVYHTHRRLNFPGGGSITVRSTHTPDNLRGAGLDFVVLDEAAFMPPTIWPEVVRPMLLDRRGGALFLSSPNGKNAFWHLYQMGVQRKRSWRHFHFTSAHNPLIDPAELAVIRAQTPEHIWRAEYLAEFTDDLGQVFRGIHAAATAPLAAQPIPGARYVFGVDWGRTADATAIVVLDVSARRMVALDRFTQLAWSHQRSRLRALYDHWQPAVILAEANSIGSPNIEALQAEGLPVRPFMTTQPTKADLIQSLSLAIERAELALLPDEALLGELAAYTVEALPAGGYRYAAPPGLHDDLVIATALAWYALRYTGLPIAFA
ncbi:MAG: terminase family protein [Anaerolineae bacterium]|nr:terminase family protein [Anaerolineae bacterium]